MTKENLITVAVGTTLEEAEKHSAQASRRKTAGGGRPLQPEGSDHGQRHPEKIEISERRQRRAGPAARGAPLLAPPAISWSARRNWSSQKVDVLAIDSAHGHSERVMEAVGREARACRKSQLIAGNVATYEGACELIALGVDGIKVGIGPGSICTTRVVSGAGVPQITAIAECVARHRGTRRPADRRRRHQVLRRHHARPSPRAPSAS